MQARARVACLALALTACGGSNPSPADAAIDGAAPTVDASRVADASVLDAAALDSGSSVDASFADVRATEIDASSPAGDAGEGVDAGPQRSCMGTPAPCEELPELLCVPGSGCQQGADGCGGTASACSTLSTADACTTQMGCTWLTPSNICLGTARICSAVQGDCFSQQGCLPQAGACTPVGSGPPDCALRANEGQCGAQTGCRWE